MYIYMHTWNNNYGRKYSYINYYKHEEKVGLYINIYNIHIYSYIKLRK